MTTPDKTGPRVFDPETLKTALAEKAQEWKDQWAGEKHGPRFTRRHTLPHLQPEAQESAERENAAYQAFVSEAAAGAVDAISAGESGEGIAIIRNAVEAVRPFVHGRDQFRILGDIYEETAKLLAAGIPERVPLPRGPEMSA